MTTVRIRFQWRRDTAANWTAEDPVLLEGEPGLETDTGAFKIGDGTTAWSALGYFNGTNAETVRDIIGTALTEGDGITITVNDGANTIMIEIDTAAALAWSARHRFVQGIRLGGASGPLLLSGSGTPESAVSAPVGSMFLRDDGGAGTSLYMKESGTGDTGWVAK